MTGVDRRTVDLSAYPDLVVIYLGMRVNTLTGLKTLLGFGPQIARSVEAKPDGLLLHENLNRRLTMAARAHALSARHTERRVLSIALVAFTSLAPAACAPPAASNVPPILLFNGTGTSSNDVAAIETILNDNHLNYSTVNSSQLNDMGESRLMAYRLMIVPGGNFIAIGDSLTSSTTANIHNAVQGGLNYLGVCAGGFLAGHASYTSLNLTSGVRFEFYAAEHRGIRKGAVAITGVGTSALDQYWEDGPQFTGWGAVVGKYPDGTPAIVEGTSGKGWVILSGVHPEAPENWRRGMTFRTPASVDNAYAGTLIGAALHGTWLSHY